MTMVMLTEVEESFRSRSGKKESYDGEKIKVVEVLNVYELGRLVTLSFLEWASQNPNGVVALPTGKTPEYFIKTLERYLQNWNDPEIIEEVCSRGFPRLDTPPETSGLRFVMLDEFFPMSPLHRNSFCNYIYSYYVKILGIKQENILHFDLIKSGILSLNDFDLFKDVLVDLSLLDRDPIDDIERKRKDCLIKVQEFCRSYDSKIMDMGGIGFFLGGIGPDGHIAFNQMNSEHSSRTRLVNFNYPSAAAAASDLGGIENALNRAAMTIGLGTITYNKAAKIIIMAAGEGKAKVVAEAIEKPVDISRPASCLHDHPNSRFYITHGAASQLCARRAEKLSRVNIRYCVPWAITHLSGLDSSDGVSQAALCSPPEDYLIMEDLIYQLSLASLKPVHTLVLSDIEKYLPSYVMSLPSWILPSDSSASLCSAFAILVACSARRLREKVDYGMRSLSMQNMRVLHTAPHHDDIMLSYHAAMHEMLGRQPGTVMFTVPGSLLSDRAIQTTSFMRGGLIGTNGSLTRSRSRSSSSSNLFGMAATAVPRLGEVYNHNLNHFAYLTSGFHSVNDDFLVKKTQIARGPQDGSYEFLTTVVQQGEITRDYDDLLSEFRDAFFLGDSQAEIEEKVENIIFLRKIVEVWMIPPTMNYALLIAQMKEKLDWLWNVYLPNHQPGDAIPKEIQLLKGCMRESEVDRVWALSSMPVNRIHHMRSKFYTDDFFTPMPNLEDDALPMANLLKLRQPHLVTVAFDPEGTGPDTHYKVLQVVAAGLKLLQQNFSTITNDSANGATTAMSVSAVASSTTTVPSPLIWGYRNVWFSFQPWEATLLIPCSAQDLELMHQTFLHCFTTQKQASFPSPYYPGPFSAWAKEIQQQQRKELGILLGEEFFTFHENEKLRNCEGFIFLRAMTSETFLREVEELKSKFENVDVVE